MTSATAFASTNSRGEVNYGEVKISADDINQNALAIESLHTDLTDVYNAAHQAGYDEALLEHSFGTATEADIIEGKTAYNGGEELVGTMPEHGRVTVNFTKAALRQTLAAGHYQQITIDTNQAYLDGYAEGKTYTTTQNSYNTIIVSPGEGTFADGTTAAKTFTGPNYTGLTMDVTPPDSHIFDRWNISVSGTSINMTAAYKKMVLRNQSYPKYHAGELILNTIKTTKLTFKAWSADIHLGGPNEWAYVNAVYDIYVDGELYQTLTVSTNVTWTDWHPWDDSRTYGYNASTAEGSKTLVFPKPSNVTIMCKSFSARGGATWNNMYGYGCDLTVEGY